MKMIRILFMFALVFGMGNAYGQVKVMTDGDVLVGGNDQSQLGVANFKTRGTSELEMSLDAVSGNADFSMQLVGQTKTQILYNTFLSGMEFRVDDANTTDGGVAASGRRLYVSGANGNIGIGTATPSEKLHVEGNIFATGTINPFTSDLIEETNFTDNGDNKSSNNSYTDGLAEVMQLNPIKFHFNGKAGFDTEDEHIGITAENLQAVSPSLVSTWTHVEYAEQSAEDVLAEKPEVIEATEEYLSINQTAITYMLVNAVKEQQAIIKALEARVIELEKK